MQTKLLTNQTPFIRTILVFSDVPADLQSDDLRHFDRQVEKHPRLIPAQMLGEFVFSDKSKTARTPHEWSLMAVFASLNGGSNWLILMEES